MIPERLAQLRQEMSKRGIDVYVVPTADFHESEYVGEHFMARKYITGFTGSAGTAVITMDEAGLWTDGRYFVQAAAQLEGTTVKLFKSGEEGVPTVDEYIKDTLKEGQGLGFDGRVVNGAWGKKIEDIAARHNVEPAVIVYAWILYHPVGAIPLVGSQKTKRLDLAIKALDVKLEQSEWFEIYSASGQQVIR